MKLPWILACLLAACGGGGDGWRTVDGPAGLTAALDVWAFSETDVWVVDGSPNIHRWDGAAWTTLATPAAGVSCVFARTPTDVWLCAGASVLRWDGATFTPLDVATPTGLSGVSDVWAAGPDDAYVVGDDAIIGHFDGNTWSRTIAGGPFKTSVWGSGPGDVYASGTFDLVHLDGGAWSEVELGGPIGGGGTVWGTGASDVWLLTDSSDLGHFDGVSWSAVETDLVGDVAAAWGPAPDDVWGVGGAGSIAHYDGDTWGQVTHQRIGAPYLRQLTAVHGSSAENVWAVGQELGEGGSRPLLFHLGP